MQISMIDIRIRPTFHSHIRKISEQNHLVDLLHESLSSCVQSGQRIAGVTCAYQRAQGNKDSLSKPSQWNNHSLVHIRGKVTAELWKCIYRRINYFSCFSYALLGQLGGLLEDYFYNLDGLVEMLISDVMSSWIHLPKFRFIFVFSILSLLSLWMM